MNLNQLEELHQPTNALYYSPDGTREIDIEVCEHCEKDHTRTEAAIWPCETIQEAHYEYEQAQKNQKIEKQYLAVVTTAAPFFINPDSTITIIQNGHAIAETTIPTQTPEGVINPLKRITEALSQLGYKMQENIKFELPSPDNRWFHYKNGNILLAEVKPVNQ